VINASHPGLVRSRLAIDQTIAFLRRGRFGSFAVITRESG
jgi:hypothetical protein